MESIQNHLLLFFTGFSRTASEIAIEQIATISEKEIELRKMMDICNQAEELIVSGRDTVKEIGSLLHEQWLIKEI